MQKNSNTQDSTLSAAACERTLPLELIQHIYTFCADGDYKGFRKVFENELKGFTEGLVIFYGVVDAMEYTSDLLHRVVFRTPMPQRKIEVLQVPGQSNNDIDYWNSKVYKASYDAVVQGGRDVEEVQIPAGFFPLPAAMSKKVYYPKLMRGATMDEMFEGDLSDPPTDFEMEWEDDEDLEDGEDLEDEDW